MTNPTALLDRLYKTLEQAEVALSNSEPTMKHLPETVKSHEDALKNVQNSKADVVTLMGLPL
jgi:hypothetical protein